MARTSHRAPADLEQALYDMGVQVWRANDDEVNGYCPGHLERVGREESHPSWSVNRLSGLHNCYSCGFKGTFLELTMYMLFPNDVFRAARWLRGYGSNLARAAELQSFNERVDEDAEEIERIELVPETQLAMYHDVPDWALEARMLSRESIDLYGVRWDAEKDAWIIPVRRPSGDLVGWQEKWQNKRRFNNWPKDMVKSACLFGYDAFPVGETAMLLESPLDVCRLHSAGYEGGLSCFGSEVSKEQIRLLVEITDELVVALDDDKSGRRMAEELRVGKWERGKLVTPGIGKLFRLRFFDYAKTGLKDIGDMEDAYISHGLYNAQHGTVARLGTSEQERQRSGVHRNSQAIPAASRRADGRQRSVPADRRRGNGQDPDDRRRSRRAG